MGERDRVFENLNAGDAWKRVANSTHVRLKKLLGQTVCVRSKEKPEQWLRLLRRLRHQVKMI